MGKRLLALCIVLVLCLSSLPLNVISEAMSSVTGTWQAQTYYSVTYYADGEFLAHSYVTEGGNLDLSPVAPSKENYTFQGWESGGQSVFEDTVVSSNMEITAVYARKPLRTKAKNEVAYLYETAGEYLSILVEGFHRKNQVPAVRKASVVSSEGTVLEAWTVDNIKNNTELYLEATLTALPTLPEGQALALYTLKDNTPVTRLRMPHGVGASIYLPLAFKGVNGIALIVVPEDEDDFEDDIPLTDDGILFANNDLYLTGKIPGNGIIEAVPVTIAMDNEEVLVAYDIRIYANANQQKKGKTWQPADKKVQVHLRDTAFSQWDEVDVYHLTDEAAVPEYVASVSAEDEWITFEAGSFSVYAIVGTVLKTHVIASDGNNYTVTVTFSPDSGIPEDAVLEATEITDNADSYKDFVLRAEETLGVGAGFIDYARFFDLTISKDGETLQPKEGATVTVEIALTDMEKGMDVQVVHFTDTPEVVESTCNAQSVSFEASGFSIYGFLSTIEEVVLASDGNRYRISVAYGPDAGIPDDTQLAVEELLEDTDAYADYLSQTVDVLDWAQDAVSYARFFDISILDGFGRKVSPLAPVQVTIALEEKIDETLSVVHYGETVDVLSVERQDDELSFESDSFSVYAVVGIILEKNILASDGHNYNITVAFGPDSGIPDTAELEVSEILPTEGAETENSESGTETSSTVDRSYEAYVARTESALGMEEGSAEYIRLFDIKIVDQADHSIKYQPNAGTTVDVRIELADKATTQEAVTNTQVVHFEDGSVYGSIVDSTTQDRVILFQASGFSVYAIIDAPSPVLFDPYDLKAINEIQEGKPYLLSYGTPKKYFTSALNSNSCLIENTDSYSAAEWYFEAVPAEENTFYIYTLLNGNKQYIHQKSGNDIELSASGTKITLSATVTPNKFFFKHSSDSRYLQHSNGGGGIRFYQNNSDATNARIYITDATTTTPSDDPYALDGKSFGIAYHDESVTAAALSSVSQTVSNQKRLMGTDLTMRPDVLDNNGILLVSGESTITEWTFQKVQQDQYYLYTTVDGKAKFLTIDGGNVYLSDSPDTVKSLITARPGTGANSGKWHFVVNGYALNLPNNTSNGFNATASDSATSWLNLVEKSVLTEEDFTEYTARKVSISDAVNVSDGKSVVIYTRVWNETTKRYEFYAVDHDGSLIRCYDTGDGIEWVGTQVNTALWQFTEGKNTDGSLSYYYWLQNTQYANYLVPQAGNGKVSYETNEVMDFNASVNLDGRRNGENYSTIIAWDDSQYSYRGLKTENGYVIPCPLYEAEDFYFAVMELAEDRQLTTVATVNNNDYGITMKMIDFNSPRVKSGTNSWRDPVQNSFFGNTDNNNAGLLSTYLNENGYPDTTALTGEAQNLGNLFSDMKDVNHLFIQSVYNESGYFEFDSTKNSAYLGENTDFTVYDQLLAVGTDSGVTRTHGQFLPYNKIPDSRIYASEATNNPKYTNQTSVTGAELSDLDPRKGEELYWISFDEADYFFGMEVSASFTQTPSGLDAWGHDIIFEFSGDDDFWLYVDDELVLDLGGVHSAMTGSVNFRTGEITSPRTTATTNTLYKLFEQHYLDRGMDKTAVNAKLSEIFTQNDKGQYVFKDYTTHEMKIFYMERGSGASNLHMRFNLAAVKPGTFLLSKKLSGAELQDSSLIKFPYQIYYYTEADGAHREHLLGATSGEEELICYEGSNRTVEYLPSFTPAQGEHNYEHVFFLKPGETAEVTLPKDAVSYKVVECGVNPDIYSEVSVNGSTLTGKETTNEIGGTKRKDYETTEDTLENRTSVDFDNHVSDGAMRTLSISKKLYDVDGTTELTYPDNESTFTFRLYLGDENADPDALPLANLYPYLIKNTENHYCMWNSSAMKFEEVGNGITQYDDLMKYFTEQRWTESQKESVIFRTSMNGSISKIPAGYTVEVRNLVISTKYKVEERDWEIPKGYTRRESDGYVRVDTSPYKNQRMPYSDTIAKDENPHIEVRNQKGWGLTAQKIWTDKDFMASHDDIYIAVYVGSDFAQIPDGTTEEYDEEKQETNYVTIYKDCVRVLRSPESELYFFFGDLYNGSEETHLFSEYIIQEVQLTRKEDSVDVDVQLDEEGYVTNLEKFTVTPISNAGILTVGGTPIGGSHQDQYQYKVDYQVGESTGKNENIRTDIVTNSRPGIELYKTVWDGAWEESEGKTSLSGALPGAKFTLTDSHGNHVAASTYTSGNNGLITTAYLSDGTYVLTEVATPQGYVGLDHPIVLTVNGEELTFSLQNENKDETVQLSTNGTVTGQSDYFSVTKRIDSNMSATVTIKNRQNHLEVYKMGIDQQSSVPLSGVHFALYRQVTDTNGTFRKDYMPMPGYENLETNMDGLISQIDLDHLGPGTYYLSEIAAPSGYKKLASDLCFTIGEDGTVTINTAGYMNWLSRKVESSGSVSYTIEIENTPLGITVRKVDNKKSPLSGAQFTLSVKKDTGLFEYVTEYALDENGLIDLSSATEKTFTGLPNGIYKLTETYAPAGYISLSKDIYFEISNGSVSLTDADGEKQSYSDVTLEDDDTTIVVQNTPGVVLPSTGGPGVSIFTLLGSLLMMEAGILLWMKKRRN